MDLSFKKNIAHYTCFSSCDHPVSLLNHIQEIQGDVPRYLFVEFIIVLLELNYGLLYVYIFFCTKR